MKLKRNKTTTIEKHNSGKQINSSGT